MCVRANKLITCTPLTFDTPPPKCYQTIRQGMELQREEELSNKLLSNMLPATVAKQLKDGRNVVADQFAAVTVLFCEICHWSDITEHLSARKVVDVLNLVYSRFDKLIEPNSCYKVETVGEVYMVVGGCPERTPDHAINCANMALAMMEAMPQVRGCVVMFIPQTRQPVARLHAHTLRGTDCVRHS